MKDNLANEINNRKYYYEKYHNIKAVNFGYVALQIYGNTQLGFA